MSTIRQQLAGYAKMARLTLIGGVAAIMVSDIVMLHMGVPRDMRRHWLLAVTFLACIPGVFVSFRMRCPRCKFNLFSLGMTGRFCPKCGVNFDEQMPS